MTKKATGVPPHWYLDGLSENQPDSLRDENGKKDEGQERILALLAKKSVADIVESTPVSERIPPRRPGRRPWWAVFSRRTRM